MGKGYGFKCKKCRKEFEIFLGVGMMFPDVYKSTIQEIYDGKYGEEWKILADSHEYAAIDCAYTLYKCDCGHWEISMPLDLYEPKNKEFIRKKQYGIKNVEEWGYVPYVMSHNLATNYNLIKKYPHRCPECGNEMKKTNITDLTEIRCPRCGNPNATESCKRINWD